MINNNFEMITDAYQLVSGGLIKGKEEDELFELGEYDANKRGYTLHPFEKGIRFDDFSMVISEKELKNHYLIESAKTIALRQDVTEHFSHRYLKSA